MTMGCLNCVWVGVALGRMALPSALEGVGVVYLETPSIGGARPHDPVGGTICRRRAALLTTLSLHSSEARGLGTQLCWGAHHSSASIGGTRPRDPAVLGAHHSSASIGGTRPRDPVTSFIRGTLPRVSHFIARGLVNQPCWWAHRSSEARGLLIQSGARGLKRLSHFIARGLLIQSGARGLKRLSHFIARGLVNQPCWWAHRSSEARGLVIQSGARGLKTQSLHCTRPRKPAGLVGSSFIGGTRPRDPVGGTRPQDSVTSLPS